MSTSPACFALGIAANKIAAEAAHATMPVTTDCLNGRIPIIVYLAAQRFDLSLQPKEGLFRTPGLCRICSAINKPADSIQSSGQIALSGYFCTAGWKLFERERMVRRARRRWRTARNRDQTV